MERVLEPEVMDDPDQARAYASADFAASNERYAARALELLDAAGLARGRVVDLGCGPAEIPGRLVRARPGLRVVAVDASAAMLAFAAPTPRVALVRGRLPGAGLADRSFDAVLSNSLLHHLPDPALLWSEVARLGRPGAVVLVGDLFRPASTAAARAIVDGAGASSDPILDRDFYQSLLASFTVEEVRAQLRTAGLTSLSVAATSERPTRSTVVPSWPVRSRSIVTSSVG